MDGAVGLANPNEAIEDKEAVKRLVTAWGARIIQRERVPWTSGTIISVLLALCLVF